MRWMLAIAVLLAPSIALADAGADAEPCDAATCNGFACRGGACVPGCKVDGDCVNGLKCDTAQAECVVPNPDVEHGGVDNSSSCAYGSSPSAPFLFALGVLGLLRRRR